MTVPPTAHELREGRGARTRGTPRLVLAAALALASCGGSSGGEAASSRDLPASSRDIRRAELAVFVPGASMSAVRSRLGGRGTFVCAGRCDGVEVAVVEFAVVKGDELSPEAERAVFQAVFEDGKLLALVDPVYPEEESYEEGGSTSTRYARRSALELLGRVLDARDSRHRTTEELARSVDREAVPHHVDWGLTIVAVPLLLLSQGRYRRDFEANAALRATFDGAAIPLGTERATVEARLGVPLETCHEGGLSISAYQGTEWFDLVYLIHYAPLVVGYRDGRADFVLGGWFAWAALRH